MGGITNTAPKLSSVVPKYSKWLSGIGRAPRSVESNVRYIMKFMREQCLSSTTVDKITEVHINKYINNKDIPAKASTRRVMLSSLRSLFYYCVAEGWCLRDPSMLCDVNVNLLSHEQKEVKQYELFKDSEVRTLIARAEGFWKPAIALGRDAGLRISDIALLEWGSIADPNSVVVWTRKGKRRVSVPTSKRIRNLVGHISGHTPKTSSKYVFPDQAQVQLASKRRGLLPMQFKRLCLSCNIKGKSFHGLRHTYASSMASKGKSLPHIASMLGHSNPMTTRIYTDH